MHIGKMNKINYCAVFQCVLVIPNGNGKEEKKESNMRPAGYEHAKKIVCKTRCEPYIISIYIDEHKYYLQVSENGTCNRTGAPYTWFGRKWYLSQHMTETEIVKTALKAVLSAVEHEVLEKFKYHNLTIFDPHLSVEALKRARVFPLDERKKRE